MMIPGLPEVASEYVATRMNARYTQNGMVTHSTMRHAPGGLGSAGRSVTAPRDNSALAGPRRVRAPTDEIMDLFRPRLTGLRCIMRPPRFARNEASTPETSTPVGMEAAVRMLDRLEVPSEPFSRRNPTAASKLAPAQRIAVGA